MKIILITGVSGSGKTTLQDELLDRGWRRPINFTTREPRSDDELDEYIFISKSNFMKKLQNGDFLEHVEYNGNFYGISNYFLREPFRYKNRMLEPATIGDKIVIVVEPIGRAQIIQYLSSRGIHFVSIFLDISKELAYKRLIGRGDGAEGAKTRAKDFDYFSPTGNCLVLSGESDTQTLANIIEGL